MKNFQLFNFHFELIEREFNATGVDNLDVHLVSKRKYYKSLGITDPQKIKQLEIRKGREMHDRVNLNLELIGEYGSVYEIEDEVMRYICMNKPPTDKSIVHKLGLPFRSIFIETEITKEDVDINVDAIKGLLISESPMYEEPLSKDDAKDEFKLKKIGRIFLVHYLCMDKGSMYIDEIKIDVDNKSGVPITYDDNKTMRFLRDYIMNFLLFINDPEVELVTHTRSDKNRQRRIKQRKMPLPSSRKVRLIGKLKKYVDGIHGSLGKAHYNYRFWVRGHTRVLTSDKYTHMRGQIIRIEPYKKGEGVLLKRTYSLDFEKGDDRVTEMNKDTLNYEDI